MKAADRFLQRWRVKRALAWIPDGAYVLDVGSADGTLFRLGGERLAGGVGVDLVAPEVWLGGDADYRTGPFPGVLQPDETFDAIVMLAVVEHIEDTQLKEWAGDCAARVSPGGRVIITVPSPLVDKLLHVGIALRILDGIEAHQHHGFDPNSLPETFRGAGFDLLTHRRFQLGLNNLFVFRKPG